MSLILEGEDGIVSHQKSFPGQLVSWSLSGSIGLPLVHHGKMESSADDWNPLLQSLLFCFFNFKSKWYIPLHRAPGRVGGGGWGGGSGLAFPFPTNARPRPPLCTPRVPFRPPFSLQRAHTGASSPCPTPFSFQPCALPSLLAFRLVSELPARVVHHYWLCSVEEGGNSGSWKGAGGKKVIITAESLGEKHKNQPTSHTAKVNLLMAYLYYLIMPKLCLSTSQSWVTENLFFFFNGGKGMG